MESLVTTSMDILALMSWMDLTMKTHIGLIWVLWANIIIPYNNINIVSSGEYLKDLDRILLPQDPVLDDKVPRPVMERGHCGGQWNNLESSWEGGERWSNRDCHSTPEDFLQPLSRYSSKVKIQIFDCLLIIFCFQKFLLERQRNMFRVAVYYKPEQHIVTKVEKYYLSWISFKEVICRSWKMPRWPYQTN